MKSLARSLALITALSLFSPLSGQGQEAGGSAHALEARDEAGALVRLEDHRGKVVLLNFWATWCKPCQEELPRLQALYEKYRAQGLVVLGVNLDTARNQAKARALRDRLGLAFPIAYDPDQRSPERYRLSKMPSSFLVDRSGVIRFVHGGFEAKDEVKIEAAIKRVLARR